MWKDRRRPGQNRSRLRADDRRRGDTVATTCTGTGATSAASFVLHPPQTILFSHRWSFWSLPIVCPQFAQQWDAAAGLAQPLTSCSSRGCVTWPHSGQPTSFPHAALQSQSGARNARIGT